MELREGIVVKTNKYQENSKIASIITKDGIAQGIIRASCNYKSKNFSYSNELTKINFDLIESHRNSFNIIASGQVISSYPNIKKDYEKLNICAKILFIMAKTMEHVNNYQNLYSLLAYTLDNLEICLDTSDENKVYCSYYYLIFKLKLLYLLGVGPNFKDCSNCSNVKVTSFSISAGGMVCPKCLTTDSYQGDYIEIMKILYLAKIDKLTLDFIKLLPNWTKEINSLVDKYYENHLSISIQ